MIKKILLFVLVVFPAMSFAQENQKIAYMNYIDVVTSMPEYKLMLDSLQKEANEYMADLQEMENDYQRKMSELTSRQDSLSETIKLRKYREIEDIKLAADNLQKQAMQEQQRLEQTLLAPIEAKARKAINEVSAENNFLYVIPNDPQLLLYISPNAIDATPLVRKKLGLQ